MDPTILHFNDKYWFFSTHLGNKSNSQFFIYYSDIFDTPYKAHKKTHLKIISTEQDQPEVSLKLLMKFKGLPKIHLKFTAG